MTVSSPTSTLTFNSYVVFGDVMESRKQTQQRHLQQSIDQVLKAAEDVYPSRFALRSLLGKEIQGTYDTLQKALAVTAYLRLKIQALHSDADTRFGIGYGPVMLSSVLPNMSSIDGPGCWAARAALDLITELTVQNSHEGTRTLFVSTDRRDSSVHGYRSNRSYSKLMSYGQKEVDAINQYLAVRDRTLTAIPHAQALSGLFEHGSQNESPDSRVLEQIMQGNFMGILK